MESICAGPIHCSFVEGFATPLLMRTMEENSFFVGWDGSMKRQSTQSARQKGFLREKQEQALEALSWTSSQRIERAGQLYLDMIVLLSEEAIQRDMERRLRQKAGSLGGLAIVRRGATP